ncbi:hypothetical protein [Nocardioides daphniae]|uniref:GerMN domain-containing protein n=1 Tax=Nocardioides daphniae TaxID=402297 RepID=A0A4P7U978_9ACTN|nr:hypothetical protein [Nocardioides daphniae]QCC76546.1 hypothetical protein E2C04_03740 [Nocardioides daphniae]
MATLVALTASACGDDDGKGAASAEASGSSVKVFMVDDDGNLVGVEKEVDGAEQMRPQGRALAAVKLLVSTTTAKGDSPLSHWGGRCAAGAKVEGLEEEGRVISVRVNGPAGVMCSRSGAELTQQRQQLAWTVIENMGADPSTPVRLYGPNRAVMWEDVVASEKVLAD